jgi:hypothetical protein
VTVARTKWRTVSCQDDGLREHSSQQKAYDWIAGQDPGARYRVQVLESNYRGWGAFATVVSLGGGRLDEE